MVWRWVIGAVGAAFLLSVSSCTKAETKECRAVSDTSLCLAKRSADTYAPEASGLRPGSEVRISITGLSLPARGLPQVIADPTGRFPPAGQNPSGVVVPPGSGPVAITITGTSANGSSVSTTFSR